MRGRLPQRSGWASVCTWIPGLAVLAREDGTSNFPHSRISGNPEANSRNTGSLLLSSSMRLITFLFLVAPTFATAHESRPAYLELNERGHGYYEVVWRRPALGEQVLALTPRFPSHCQDSAPHTASKEVGAILERWTITCGESGLTGQAIAIDGLSRTITDVLVRVSLRAGSSGTYLLRAANPSAVIQSVPTPAAVASQYFMLGVEHIWGGIDHLLFVLGLLLLVQSRWLLFKTITAFTVAHSLTLGLATLGMAHIPQAPVEAVIALSILFLAGELAKDYMQQSSSSPPTPPLSTCLRGHPDCWAEGGLGKNSYLTTQHPWLVAFTFGLLHGFGFAGALADVGLPSTDIPLALSMFNVGVEIGQLAFIFVMLTAAACARHGNALQAPAWRWTTVYAIGSLSAFWLIQRIVAFF